MTVAVDSWAVLEWLQGEEPAYSAVESCVADGRPVMSWLNAAEVFYRVSRKDGHEKAVEVINEMRFVFDLELPTERRIIEAAQLKAANPIALADCSALSCAADNDSVLYTGDPEILDLESPPCELRDLRG